MNDPNRGTEFLELQTVYSKIYIVRGRRVMTDKDLAVLYGVPVKRLNEAVKRNMERFPGDFMFKLTKSEIESTSRSQFATLKIQGGNIKYAPYVFTEQGIAMLSSVLKSSRAIQVNIQIIRIFTTLRDMIGEYKELREKVEEMEKYNEANFKEIFEAIRALVVLDDSTEREIGFRL